MGWKIIIGVTIIILAPKDRSLETVITGIVPGRVGIRNEDVQRGLGVDVVVGERDIVGELILGLYEVKLGGMAVGKSERRGKAKRPSIRN